MREQSDTTNQLDSYRDAVWSYLLEHCDLEKSGALFVKFHTSDRRIFERHIKARWKFGYHRGDPVAKNETHLERRFEHQRKKWEAKERYLRNRIRGRRILAWRRMLSRITHFLFKRDD
jgi:hypothetical protein